MKTIGRSLAFYLKYLEEMQALYESEDEDISENLLSEVSNRDELRKMIEQIGKSADEQVSSLLTGHHRKGKENIPYRYCY